MLTKTLLVVDDEKEICQLVCDIGQVCGYHTEACYTAEQFKNFSLELNPDVIVIDLHLTDSDGVELLRFLAEQNTKAPIILISGYDAKILTTSMLLGKEHGLDMLGVLHKPFKASQLQQLLSNEVKPSNIIHPDRIQEAINKNYLVLYYQPQISMSDKKIYGVEALVRMQFPGEPLIMPDQFISIAEKAGLINNLTDWVFKQSIHQLAQWNRNNIDVKMSINFSSDYFNSFEVPDRLEEYLLALGVKPSSVTIELTESSVHGKPGIFMDILARLRLKNFSLAMDDFGIGYSSLIELYKMPFNLIKIDKSFVMNMTKDHDAQAIVGALIHLFQELNIAVVAEGVESKQILDMLDSFKCNFSQGYYFSKPLPPEQFEKFISEFSAKDGDKDEQTRQGA